MYLDNTPAVTIPNKKPIPVTAICCAMTELKFNGLLWLMWFLWWWLDDTDTVVVDDTDDDTGTGTDDKSTKSVMIVCTVIIKNPIAMVPTHFCNAMVTPFIGCMIAVVVCNTRTTPIMINNIHFRPYRSNNVPIRGLHVNSNTAADVVSIDRYCVVRP